MIGRFNPDPMPLCPSCGLAFDESIPNLPSKVLTFGHAEGGCIAMYGRDLENPDDPLVRLGDLNDVWYDFGDVTIGRPDLGPPEK
jgi:hypothetical protein